MKTSLWQLTVQDSFAAAHALRHYQGKCEALHGHNFGVEVCVEGQKLEEPVQIVLDFGLLKQELKAVLKELDHKHLNEIPAFQSQNPSSENLARFIFQNLQPKLAPYAVRLVYVSVAESPKQSANYMEIL